MRVWCVGERRDHPVPCELADREHGDACDYQADPRRRVVRRRSGARKIGRGEGHHREPEEDPSDRAERVDGGAHLLDLLGRRDLQLGDVRRQPIDGRGRQTRLGGHLLEQRAEVEVDRHVRPSIALSRVWCAARFASCQAVRAAALPSSRGAFLRATSLNPSPRPRKRLQCGRQRCLEALLDLVTVVQGLDEVEPDRGADRLVLEQVGAGVDPVVGVQRLALGPDADAGADHQEGAGDQQRHYGGSALRLLESRLALQVRRSCRR